MTNPRYTAFRAFRSDAAEQSGKRGRRLVVDHQDKTVGALGSGTTDEGTIFGGMRVESYLGEVGSKTALKAALKASKTPVLVEDEALTAYVNEHDGQLPLEGLRGAEGALDDFVDQRPQAVNRAAKKAARELATAAA
jgi:hypothetical protein